MKTRFAFGKNWGDFLGKHYSHQRLTLAEKSIREFLPDLKGKTFLDIGCGSGLFSLAALRLGAKQIFSFDYDKNSVDCCASLYQKVGSPKTWRVTRGDVLDKNFLDSLPLYDVVYSWGVLHHTGKMWDAITNAAQKVKPSGLFYISIYNKVNWPIPSWFWVIIKQFYNKAPVLIKRFMGYAYTFYLASLRVLKFENPFTMISEYEERGMEWYTDIRDWLGGYPYEYATVDEITSFVENLGFETKKIKPNHSTGTSEFLFSKI